MFLNKLLQIIQIILKIAGIILLILAVGAFVLLNINWKIFYTDKDAEIPPNMITPTPIVFMSPTPVIINTSVKSLNDPDIKLINSDNAENMFVEYFKQIYSIISPEWTGDQYEALKITLNNFTTDNFNSYKNWLDLQKVSKTIPTELNSIYLTTQASKDFIAVIQSAQSDFIKYLQVCNK